MTKLNIILVLYYLIIFTLTNLICFYKNLIFKKNIIKKLNLEIYKKQKKCFLNDSTLNQTI